MRPTKRIRTVLYGDQRVSPAELEVLHTPAMQRLYGLRQLGSADRVFVDASHSRFHHVVGVVHHAERLTSAIVGNLQRSSATFSFGSTAGTLQSLSAPVLSRDVQRRKPVIRLIALLHDLTHAPFGHTVEDEIQLVESKHDEPERQADAFYRLLSQLVAWLAVDVGIDLPTALSPFLSQGENSETPAPQVVADVMVQLLDTEAAAANACWRLQNSDIARLLAHLNCAMTALLHLEALHTREVKRQQMPRPGEYPFQGSIRLALTRTQFGQLFEEFRFRPHRDAYMLDVVGNTVCADLLDYAERDSHYLGMRLDHDPDRIAENFTLVSWDASAYERERTESGRSVPEGMADPFEGWCLRTAISLFTHKFRSDIPSELMNLLNVRFYLYERAIFHPTKCASGAMLGTALQLLGWRRQTAQSQRPQLPKHLRFAGDDVFLHGIRAAASCLVDWCGARERDHVVDQADVDSLRSLQRLNGLDAALLEFRLGQSVAQAEGELRAARRLLDRLGTRRYLRPVFRALPNAKNQHLQIGAPGLADVFRDPDCRYDAERRIEEKAGLPLGSVVIHCPRHSTAAKIANVLLVEPTIDVSRVYKLRDIGSLDDKIFGQHEKAIKAVEKMYASMWRLVVFAAPERLAEYKRIAQAAGRVIFETMDKHGHYAGDPDKVWPNDPTLERELESKLNAPRGLSLEHEDSSLTGFGLAVGRIADEFLSSTGAVVDASRAMPEELESRIKAALSGAITRPAMGAVGDVDLRAGAQANSVARLIEVARTYRRLSRKDVEALKQRYQQDIARLTEQEYAAALDGLQRAIRATPPTMTVHKGWKLNELTEVFDDLLREQIKGSRGRSAN